MNWQMANRIAQIAAVKAHDRLGIDAAGYPISTSRGIDGAGLTLCWRPLPKLFGMYIEAGGNRGVLVSNMFTRATRRHTAAHELGHHEFQHVPNPSTPCSMERQSASARSGIGRQGETEMTAEAFAAWYLMPRRAVIAARADLGLVDPLRPQDVYQLSLRLGTTYRATCRQLFGLRMATWKQVQEWLKVQPGSLKRGAARAGGLGELASTLDIDVWVVDGGSDQEIVVSDGDIVVGSVGHAVRMHTAASAPIALASLSTTGGDRDAWRCEAAVVDGEAVTSTAELLDAETGARVKVTVEPRPFGLYTPHWPSAESAQTGASATEGRDDDARTTQAVALSSARGGAEGARP